MISPVSTIADALIAFILSLLRDPSTAEEFAAAPTQTMADNGLEGACLADVQAVRPVIIDHPSVTPKPPAPPPPSPPEPPNEVVREINRIINQFTSVDARTTIVDQSVNQNIWTEGGDVTQIFDQEAVVASGDNAVAAGDDATVVDSDVDITVGDVAIGNTSNDDSFNTTVSAGDNSTTTTTEAASTGGEEPADEADAATAVAAVTDAVDTVVETTVEVVESAPAESAPAEPAPLSTDLTAEETYDDTADSAAPVEEPYFEEPTEEQ